MRMKLVMNPKFNPQKRAVLITDYVYVPAIEAINTWPMRDLLTPVSKSRLAILANSLEGR